MTTNTPKANEGNEVGQSLRHRPPFTQTPDWIALAPITAQAFRLYVLLAAHVNQSRDDTEVWPTHEQLAAMMGLAKADAIKPYADELVALGAISRTTIRTHGGMRKRNRYTVRGVVPGGWDGASSIAEFHDHLKEKSQVTPEPPNLGVPEPPHEGSPEPPNLGVPEPPHEGAEPDQPELDECEPDQPTTGPVGNAGSEGSNSATGWLAEETKNNDKGSDAPSAGERLLVSIERRNHATLTAKRSAHVATIDAALETLPRDQVMAVLGDGLDTATQPAGALVGRIRQLPDTVAQRQAEQQARAEREQRLNDRDNRTGNSQPPSTESPQGDPASSPVGWLTDAQYAQLTRADRAVVQAHGTTAPHAQTEFARDRLARIQASVDRDTAAAAESLGVIT